MTMSPEIETCKPEVRAGTVDQSGSVVSSATAVISATIERLIRAGSRGNVNISCGANCSASNAVIALSIFRAAALDCGCGPGAPSNSQAGVTSSTAQICMS